MNLDFEKDNFRFNARVSAIIYNKEKDKILIFKTGSNDYYMLPGGRIEMFEDSLTAIKREVAEETGFKLDYELSEIQENFITKGDKKIMQYCFCYKAVYNGLIKNEFKCLDNESQTFIWVDINKLNEYKLVPKSTYNLVLSNNNLKHIIEKC